MAAWYYRIGRCEQGPVPDLELAALFAAGVLKPADEIRAAGDAAWQPAHAALSLDRGVVKQTTPSQSDEWFWKSNGEEFGPVPFQVIQNLITTGAFRPQDYLKPGRNGAWQRAGRIEGLSWESIEAASTPDRPDAMRSTDARNNSANKRFDGRHRSSALVPPETRPAGDRVRGNRSAYAKRDTASRAVSRRGEEAAISSHPASRDRSSESSGASELDAASSETPAALSSTTPVPPLRPHASLDVAGAAAAVAKAAPKRRSFSFRVDLKWGLAAGLVVAMAAGVLLVPWGQLLTWGSGPAPAILPKAEEMWAQVQKLRDDKAEQSQWDELRDQLDSSIGSHLAELKPYVRSSELARQLYQFESSALKPILSRGRAAPGALFQNGQKILEGARRLLASK